MYIHGLFIGECRSFSNTQGIQVFECCYFLNGSFYELANHYVFKYQAQKLCDSFICTFSVFWLSTHLYVPPICASIRDTRMNPDVKFIAFKILFHEILIMLGIQVYNKNIFFYKAMILI